MAQNEEALYAVRDLTGKKLGTCFIEKMIGKGGMGEVYLAYQEQPARRVAVKTLRSHLSMDRETSQQFRKRFQREADLIARLDHVNIIPIYEYGEYAGIGYLVMPYVTGGSLRDLLKRQGTLSLAQVLIYLEQAANALDYAHEQGIIHRDLKPDNFLLHADGRLILADFGIARILTSDDDQSSAGAPLTGTGVLLGTPEYMAPEMIRGEALDRRADIYELGIVLYQMLSGSLPFRGNAPFAVAAMQLQQSLPSLHASNPAIPLSVDVVLRVATAKTPTERFQTVGALAQAFREALRPLDVSLSLASMNAQPLSPRHNVPPTILEPVQEIRLPINASAGADMLSSAQPFQMLFLPEAPAGLASSVTSPQTRAQPVQVFSRQSRRQLWVILLSICAIAILVVGGILIGLQLNHSNSGPVLNRQSGLKEPQSTVGISPVASNKPLTPTATPSPKIPKGAVLYTTKAPGALDTNASCDGGSEQWADYNAPAITCHAGNAILHNPQLALAGIILTALPDNAFYPSNYVVEAQIREDTASAADFGLYFRNQPGNAEGIYTFLIHSDGSWASYVYDNQTGAPTQISHGSAGVYAYAQLTLDVVVDSSDYTFYVNGQKVGQAHDVTYQSGTAGVAVEAGGTITVSSFTLYNLL